MSSLDSQRFSEPKYQSLLNEDNRRWPKARAEIISIRSRQIVGFSNYWQDITKDKCILSGMKCFKIPFIKKLTQNIIFKEQKLSSLITAKRCRIYGQTMQKLIFYIQNYSRERERGIFNPQEKGGNQSSIMKISVKLLPNNFDWWIVNLRTSKNSIGDFQTHQSRN